MFRILITLVAFLLSLPIALSAVANEKKLLIFAASSMRDVMQVIALEYEKQCECQVSFSFAASSTLARQIYSGAPASIFISANEDWITWLSEKNVIHGDQAKSFAGNRLVIAVSKNYSVQKQGMDILENQKFAMADPRSVPAGIYARQAFEKIGVWETIKPNSVYTENVRIALGLVARGDLKAGIVYKSDLRVEPRVKQYFELPENSHNPVQYWIVGLDKENQAENGFMKFLMSGPAQEILGRYEFTPIDEMISQ